MPELRTLIGAHDLLLPIPMPLSRMREHGQHHAANLCRWIARETGRPGIGDYCVASANSRANHR